MGEIGDKALSGYLANIIGLFRYDALIFWLGEQQDIGRFMDIMGENGYVGPLSNTFVEETDLIHC